MKKWILLFILISLIVAAFFFWKKSTPQLPDKVLSAIEAPTATPSSRKQSIVIDLNGVPIRISWAIAQPKDVNLYSNLAEQHLSEQIKVDKSCSVLVSGGFYSEENTHLGLFTADFKTISKFSQNSTRNGFIWINSDNKITIGPNLPNTNIRWGLQSGPLLMLNKKSLSLFINNDEPERRIASGVINDNKLIFLAFYRNHSDLQGPLLSQLPEIINLFKKQTGIDIADAINLDGGSHSIFISNNDLLRESAIIGSYFCAK